MALLPEHSSAQLVMLTGSLCSMAELALFLEQFDYQEDPNESGHWILVSNDPTHAGCSLRIANEGEAISIFGEAVDHYARVNYLIQKAGWAECSVLSRDDDTEAKLVGRLVSVGITSATTAIPASTLRASVAPAAAPISAQASTSENLGAAPEALVVDTASPDLVPAGSERVAGPIDSLTDEHERIETLTIRNNALEEKVAELESENSRLQQSNRELSETLVSRPSPSAALAQQAPAVATRGSPAGSAGHLDAHALIAAIENHVSESLDLSAINATQLVKDLQKLGYVFKVRLVPSAP